MRWIILAICFAWAVLAEDNAVVTLTDDNFDEYIKSNKYVMVKFYAPWCGHCKTLAPEYEKAAKQAKEKLKPYVLGEVDATIQTKTATKFSVRGYPTVKLFIEGIPIDFEGDRKAEPILAFIDKKVQPPSVELKSVDDIKARNEAKSRRCILVSDNESVLKNYMAVARTVDEFNFFHTSEALGKEVYPEISKFPAVVILRDFDEKKIIYTDEIDTQNLVKYLHRLQFATVSAFDQDTVNAVFQKATKKGVMILFPPIADEKVKEEFKQFATAKKSDEFLFMAAGSKDEWGQRLVGFLGVEEKDLPVVEIIDARTGEPHRFRYKGELTATAMAAFLDDFKKGKIDRFMKSEEIPKENPGPVYKAVGKSFKADVIDNDMDVMVKFYAEWCGHCKKLAPIYDGIASNLSHNKKLKLVEIDATKNDIEGLSIHGFPTIYFYPAGKKSSPIKFEGERTNEAIVKFLKEKCTNPIEEVKKDL